MAGWSSSLWRHCLVATVAAFLCAYGCTDLQTKQHCSACTDGECTACAADYLLNGQNRSMPCIAARLTQPPDATPLSQPKSAVDLNGVIWPQMSINRTVGNFMGIGDWGGVGSPPTPSLNLKGRKFIKGIDDNAQVKVAEQMGLVAGKTKPDFVLNAGDNFYPGGIDTTCGASPASGACSNGQFQSVFENIYTSAGLQDAPWFGVLGNHDYGGVHFDAGWDTQILRTWCPGNKRWRLPAQFWSQRVQYADFAVDFFMLDSNYQDAGVDYAHNICRIGGNCLAPTCDVPGLKNGTCPPYFQKLWQQSLNFLEEGMEKSTAEWQVVLTHYPGPSIINHPGFKRINQKYGVDLLFTGHAHYQAFGVEQETPYIISGGGGGITSDVTPSVDGNDDAYGFVNFEITRDEMTIYMHGHSSTGGVPVVRKKHTIQPRKVSEVSLIV